MRAHAAASALAHPAGTSGTVDWRRADELRCARALTDDVAPPAPPPGDASGQRALARPSYASGQLAEARQHWQAQGEAPVVPADTTMVAESLADGADPQALPSIDAGCAFHPAEAEAFLAMWHTRAGSAGKAAAHLATAFETYRRVVGIVRRAQQCLAGRRICRPAATNGSGL
jgi:hypothetical protein